LSSVNRKPVAITKPERQLLFQELFRHSLLLFGPVKYPEGYQVVSEKKEMDMPIVRVIGQDPDNRELIGLNLRKRGFRALEGCSQSDLASKSANPQLIILEVNAEDESGWQAAREVRYNSTLQGTPLILLVTAAPSTRRLVPLQPVRWLEKPLAMEAALAMVKGSLEKPASNE
jgi:DNA-binding response OmpR family regulator